MAITERNFLLIFQEKQMYYLVYYTTDYLYTQKSTLLNIIPSMF